MQGWLAEYIKGGKSPNPKRSHELNLCTRPTMDDTGDGSNSSKSHSHHQEQPVAAAGDGGDGGGDISGSGSGTTSPSAAAAVTYSQHRQQHASIVNACIQDLSSRGVVATTGVSHAAAAAGGISSSSSFAGRQLNPTPLDASAAAPPAPASSLHHGRGYPTVGSATSSTTDGAHPQQQMQSLGGESRRGEQDDDLKAKEDRVTALREEQERRMRVKRISKEGAATGAAAGGGGGGAAAAAAAAASSTAATSALTGTGSDAAKTSATDTANAPALDSSSPAGSASPSNAPSPAATPTSATASAPAPSTTTTAAATPSAPATAATPAVGPPGWFVCSVCKARAFASEADLSAHQTSCAAEAAEAERREQYAKEQAALMEKLNSARAEVAALESAAARQQESMQQSMRQLPPQSATGAAVVPHRPQQQPQHQQHPVVGMSQQQMATMYGMSMGGSTGSTSSTSAVAASAANRSTIDSLQFGDVNRLAMQEMARRAVAASQGLPPPPPPSAALQYGQRDQYQIQQQMQLQQMQLQHVQMQIQQQQQQQQERHRQEQRQRKQQQKYVPLSESKTSAAAAAASPRGAAPMPAQVAGGSVENGAHLEVPVPLGIPLDKDMLTPLHCFVREHCVQIFTATEEDVNAPSKGKRRPIVIGQVGIRCPHCKGRPIADANKSQSQTASSQYHGNSSGAERGSVYYPFTIASIYNATMNLLQRHLPYCSCIPAWTLDRYRDLKTDDARSGTSKQYWIDAARRLGLIDTSAGIRYDPKLVEPSLGAESQDGMMTSVPTSGGGMPTLGPPSGASRDFYSNQSNASTRTINMDTCKTVGGAALLTPHQHAAAAMRAAAVKLGMSPDEPSPHQPNNMLTSTGPADDAVRLVDPADRPLATSFSYYIMSQMQKCHFAEADRLGKRKALPLGFAGLACRHCYGGYGSGRFFPQRSRLLAILAKLSTYLTIT